MQRFLTILAINLINASNFKVQSNMLLVSSIILFVASSIHACPTPSGSEPRKVASVISQEGQEKTTHLSSTKSTAKKQIQTTFITDTITTITTITTLTTQTKRPYLDFNRLDCICINELNALHSIIVSYIIEICTEYTFKFVLLLNSSAHQ